MYLKATNGVVEKYPYSIGLLRKDNPRTSFPKNLTDAVLAGYAMYPVREANPTVGTDQKLVKSWTPEFINGEWVLNHQAVDMTAEEIAERDGVIAANVREDRDKRLTDTDWRFRSDMNPSQDWIDYCQALRDVPAQEGFPHDVTWPDQPE